MFGGSSSGRDTSFNDLNMFCTSKKVWTKLNV